MKRSQLFSSALLLAAALFPAGVFAQDVTLTPVWSLAPGSRPYLTTDGTQRGIAYNPDTGNVLLVNRNTALNVQRIRASDGADMGALNIGTITAASGGTFAINMIGVGGDGGIYVANLTTSAANGNIKVYKWANESASPTLVFDGRATGDGGARFGDTLDVRGSGATTEIFLGARAAREGTVLRASDASATSFSSSVFTTTAGGATSATAPMGLGLAYGNGNTIYGTGTGVALRQFDLSSGTVLNQYSNAQIPFSIGSIGYDSGTSMLGGINYLTGTDEFRLYDMSNASSPVLLGTGLFPANNVNGADVGSVHFGGGQVYALDSNNGLVAYGVPEPAPLLIAGLAFGALALYRRFRD